MNNQERINRLQRRIEILCVKQKNFQKRNQKINIKLQEEATKYIQIINVLRMETI